MSVLLCHEPVNLPVCNGHMLQCIPSMTGVMNEVFGIGRGGHRAR
jgi:hypothetical protein